MHATEDRTTPADPAQLPRALGAFSATAVVIGTIIGSGIFRVPAPVAADAGSVGAIALLWILGGAIALAGALSIAELAAMYPRAGGIYVFLRETYGPLPAFLFGWGMLLVNPASYAAVALIFSASVATLLPMGDFAQRLLGAAMLAVLVIVNVRSIRVSAVVENLSTTLKVGALLALALAAFLVARPDAGAFARAVEWAPASWTGFGIALIAVMFAYDGWQWLPQLAAEVKQPERSLPRALIGGVVVVLVTYLAINAAILRVLPIDEIAASPLVTADLAGRLFGVLGISLVALLVALATLSSNHAGFMTDPRVYYAMAADGLFFRRVATIHPRWKTPHIAIVALGAVAIVYVFIRSFEQLAAILILGMWPFLAAAVAATMILRRRRPDLQRPFRIPLYPLPPLFFLTAATALFVNALLDQPITTLLNFGVLALGVPAYRLWRGWQLRSV